ncbi:MAG: hypothetical protein AB7D57_09690 [Desulfovibrionaceae bacterium]
MPSAPPCTVLVLGDSASAVTGSHVENHLDMFRGVAWDRPVRIVTPSAVGMTMSDALLHYREQAPELRPDAVVVYLGNCDACAYGPAKPRLRRWSPERVAAANAKFKRATPLALRNKPFQFREFDLAANALTPCVPPADYEVQLAELAGAVLADGGALVLVNPVSKADYPPCNNIGNFLYYKIFGLHERLPLRPCLAADRLTQAIRLHEAGRTQEADDIYYGVGEARRGEFRHIALNNRAAMRFDAGRLDEAEALLREIPEAGNPLYSIVLFNLARVAEARGDAAGAAALRERARTLDLGTYRVTAPYRQAVARVARRFEGRAALLDMAPLAADADFVDYCHPDRAACVRLHRRLREELEGALGLAAGDVRAEVAYLPLNPDRYAGGQGDFYQYYQFAVAPDPAAAEAVVAAAAHQDYPALLEENAAFSPDAGRRHVVSILSHPVLGLPGFLAAHPPARGLDQGRVAEFYFLRHLAPAYAALAGPGLPFPPGDFEPLLPLPDKFRAWWATTGEPGADPETLRRTLAGLDWAQVWARAAALLDFHLRREPSLAERCRTISYWFFRESLIFGTASHPLAMTDRLTLWKVMDTCLLCAWGLEPGHPGRAGLDGALERLRRILAAHRRHLGLWAARPYAMPPEALEAYRRDLAEAAAGNVPAGA